MTTLVSTLGGLPRRLRDHLPGTLVVLAFLLLWQWYAGIAAGGGLLLPTPIEVLATLAEDWNIIAPALGVTLGSAAQGLAWGVAVAFAFALIAVALPILRRPLTRQLTIVFCLPLAAIAPLLFLVLDLPGPHIALAAISVVFPVYIALVQGLTARHREWEDLRAVLGGGRPMYFLRVQIPSGTRELLVAARIAIPTAILGTTLAEYFGGARGVGVLMINSLAQLNAPRAYALGVVITLVCAASFLAIELITRLLPWTEELTR
ncbi:ABC transporter permease subunit [Aeromicrobium sp. PE09-221]|uniref:ABC transporter permease n=1 Tax=Aeromicrobium sp. PE09-221 TaxID=1898043 RepID=UPI001122D971|nr:ABC transporter permease subunit [Aeromicrobium sp. PE09-221]